MCGWDARSWARGSPQRGRTHRPDSYRRSGRNRSAETITPAWLLKSMREFLSWFAFFFFLSLETLAGFLVERGKLGLP